MIRNYVTTDGNILHTEQVGSNLNERPNMLLIDILAIVNGVDPSKIYTEVVSQ